MAEEVWLNPDQVLNYRKFGFLVLKNMFNEDEVESLRRAFQRDAERCGDHLVMESDKNVLRSLYASHLRQPEYASLIRTPRLLVPARQLVDSDVYVYQLKINSKSAFSGGGWSWHQDFAAWKAADSLPTPRLVNAICFLDSVDEYNGPIVFVPGSHRNGLAGGRVQSGSRTVQHLDPAEIALTPPDIRKMVDQNGLYSAKGGAGSVVLFHPEIIHGSATNMSPYDRRIVIITYNDVNNLPRRTCNPRPEYLVGRDTRALRFVDEVVTAERGV